MHPHNFLNIPHTHCDKMVSVGITPKAQQQLDSAFYSSLGIVLSLLCLIFITLSTFAGYFR